MTATELETLPELYEQDETAWLEQMAELIRNRQIDQLDLTNLAEYLDDMARRDRREVQSRLTTLLAHILKWLYQPERRSGGWHATVLHQQFELADMASSGVLRTHAEAVLDHSYANAIKQAAVETGLSQDTFPKQCPYSIEELLNNDPLAE
jgi:Domain of unknown function DUF29